MHACTRSWLAGTTPLHGPPAAATGHRLGQVLLQGKWKEAVELLLRPSAGARDEVVQAWKMYSEGDVDGALRTMPRNMVVEPAILQARRRGGAQGGAGGRPRCRT